MKISEITKKYTALLKENNIGEYENILKHILSFITQIPPLEIFLNSDYELDHSQLYKLEKMIKKILIGYPLSWVLKKHSFCGIDFFIKKGVFVPRPESEELSEMVLKESFKIKNPKILDFCAGIGVIGMFVAIKNKKSDVYAIEKSKKACEIIKINKDRFKLKNYKFRHSNKIDVFNINYDIVVSNPPYIPSYMYNELDKNVKVEPKSSLIGGDDGLKIIKYIATNIDKVAKKGSLILIETGEYYSDKLSEIFKSKKFKDFAILKDINKKDRFVRVRYHG